MTPILQREDGGMEELRGEEARMKAEPAKAEEGREEGKDGGRGGEQQSKAAGPRQKQKGKRKQIFFLLAAGKEPFMFLYNEQSSRKK